MREYNAEIAFNKIARLFGAPPLRKNERFENFKEAFAEFFNALEPQDFVAEVHIYHIAIDTWSIFQLVRDRAILVEKKELDNRIRAARLNRKRMIATGEALIGEEFGFSETTERKTAIKELYNEADRASAEELKATATDIDYAVIVEEYENLDRIDIMIDRHFRRRDATLHQLGWYNATFAKKTCKISDAIIDGSTNVAELEQHEVPLLSSDALVGEDGQSLPPA
jgi:hypothetical protein